MKCNFCGNTVEGTMDQRIDKGWNWATFRLKPGGRLTVAGCPQHKEEFTKRVLKIAEGKGES